MFNLGVATPQDMLQLLRDTSPSLPDSPPDSPPGNRPLAIGSSQMSVLGRAKGGGGAGGCHWFTATPDPKKSLFKPFVFSEHATIGDKTAVPVSS